jgi:hypothetical protein
MAPTELISVFCSPTPPVRSFPSFRGQRNNTGARRACSVTDFARMSKN